MKQRFGIILVFVVLSLIGVLALPRVPFRFEARHTGQSVNISYSWPNANPKALERQVTTPLEGVLGTLSGVNKITSSSAYHSGSIFLALDKGIDPDRMRFEVAALIRQTYRHLPDGVTYPQITINNPDDALSASTLLSFQMNGGNSSAELRAYIKQTILPRISALKGIQSVNVYGGDEMEWVLTYLPEQLETLGIAEEDIIKVLSGTRSVGNLGWVTTQSGLKESVTLLTETEADSLGSLPVKQVQNRTVHLRDLVQIQWAEKSASSFFRINGQNAVQIVISSQSAVNQLEIAKRCHAEIKAISVLLPHGYGIRTDYDATEFISEGITRMTSQIVLLLSLLLLLVALVFRNWKDILTVFSGLVICSLLSGLLFYIFKIEMRLYSVGALAVALGLITGNMLVMRNHYFNYRSRGMIGLMTAVWLLFCLTFSIITFLPEETRADLDDFFKLLMVFQAISLPVCYWYIPAVMEQLGKKARPKTTYRPDLKNIFRKIYSQLLTISVRFKVVALAAAIIFFGLPVFMLPTRLDGEGSFEQSYNRSLGNDWYLENLRPYLDKGLGGTLRLFMNYVYEYSAYRSNERTVLYIQAGMPNHSTVEQMGIALKRMEAELSRYPEIDRFITHVENGQLGSITVYFKKAYDQSYFPFQMKSRAIGLSTEMSGIDWNIYGVGQGFNVNVNEKGSTSFNLLLKGYNYAALEGHAQYFRSMLLSHPRIQEVDINRIPGSFSQKDLYAYKIVPDAAYWASLGITDQALFSAIKKNNVRPTADLYLLINNEYQAVTIKPVDSKTYDIFKLEHSPLHFPNKQLVRMDGFAKMEKELITPVIKKENQQYIRQVSFEYMGSNHFGRKFLEKTLAKFNQDLPLGYSTEILSYSWWGKGSGKQYAILMLVLTGIFIVLAVVFESLRKPFTVIAAIPMSFTGVFLAFYWTDAGFDQGGYASLLILSSIASFPVLLVVSAFGKARKASSTLSDVDAFVKALANKYKEILLFIAPVSMGAVPYLIFGVEHPFWYSFAVGTLGGLFAALLSILFFVPILLCSRKRHASSRNTTESN